MKDGTGRPRRFDPSDAKRRLARCYALILSWGLEDAEPEQAESAEVEQPQEQCGETDVKD